MAYVKYICQIYVPVSTTTTQLNRWQQHNQLGCLPVLFQSVIFEVFLIVRPCTRYIKEWSSLRRNVVEPCSPVWLQDDPKQTETHFRGLPSPPPHTTDDALSTFSNLRPPHPLYGRGHPRVCAMPPFPRRWPRRLCARRHSYRRRLNPLRPITSPPAPPLPPPAGPGLGVGAPPHSLPAQ